MINMSRQKFIYNTIEYTTTHTGKIIDVPAADFVSFELIESLVKLWDNKDSSVESSETTSSGWVSGLISLSS